MVGLGLYWIDIRYSDSEYKQVVICSMLFFVILGSQLWKNTTMLQ